MNYTDFISQKSKTMSPAGFAPATLSGHLFPFQSHIVEWAVRLGRAAIFADTGLGKTAMQLEWSYRVQAHTGGRVLILAPLAVAHQTEREARRFGLPCCVVDETTDDIVQVTNYQKLHRMDPSAYDGIVLDESSILKSIDGKTKEALIDAFSRTPYRLACTATPAPNDHTEFGNHTEFLGIMKRSEMLARYFVHDGGDTSKWRLKGHARGPFWRFVSGWAKVVSHPRDIGFDDVRFDLPPIQYHEHIAPADHGPCDGQLFKLEAHTMNEQRKARRGSLAARAGLLEHIIGQDPDAPWLVWCDMNAESEAAASIAACTEIRGSHSDEAKAEAMLGFSDGKIQRIVTKPSIAGFGMNWQHCSNVAFLGVSHSFERFYQAIRRCWRFGATRPVQCHIITSELEGPVLKNIKRKAAEWKAVQKEMVKLAAH